VAVRLRVPETYLRDAAGSLRSPRAWQAFGVEQRALLRELPTLERQLGRITAETLILVGSEDRVVPPRSVELLSSQISGARLQMLPGAGHLLPLFQAERLAEILLGHYD
jgi:pimeloyl-ACP methyl ester carboxylesterase